MNEPIRQSDVPALTDLVTFIRTHAPLFVLTGAGCSTASGLGDYRDKEGQWKRRQPITGDTFIKDECARKRYWARSAVGWPDFSGARPNQSHTALAGLGRLGYLQRLVTQNVDGLHQLAGQQDVLDLHGRLSTVTCIECQTQITRDDFQVQLLEANPDLLDISSSAVPAPDGDTDLEDMPFDWLLVPACPDCGGILKPDVVFFGESVPRHVVDNAMQSLENAGGLLVAGSSLMVYSGFRFCKRARELEIPIAIINRGKTRADDLAFLRVDADCGQCLQQLLDSLN